MILSFAELTVLVVPGHSDQIFRVPQMMVLLTGPVRAEKARPAALKLQALEGWLALTRALLQHAPAQLSGVMHQAGCVPSLFDLAPFYHALPLCEARLKVDALPTMPCGSQPPLGTEEHDSKAKHMRAS